MRLPFVLLLYVIGTGFALTTFPFGACLYLWSNIFQPIQFAYGGVDLPIAQYVFVIFALSYIINMARGKFRPRANFYLGGASVFLIWMFISAAHSPNSEPAREGAVLVAKYLLPLMLMSTGLRSRTDIKCVAAILMLSVGIWSAQAGVFGLSHGVARNMGIKGGQMTDNNDFMAAALGIVPIIFYFFQTYDWRYRRAVKSVLACMGFLTLAAVVFSNSRGATVGLVGTVFFYLTIVSKRKVRDILVLAAVVAIVLPLLPDAYFDRLSTIELSGQQTEASAAGRVELMKAAWRGSLDNPIFGLGPDCWLMSALNYGPMKREPHSAYLKLSAETGFIGLGIFLFVCFATVTRLLILRHHALIVGDVDARRFCEALVTALVGIMIPFTFLNQPYSEFLWAWFAVSHAFAIVYKEGQFGQGDDDDEGDDENGDEEDDEVEGYQAGSPVMP